MNHHILNRNKDVFSEVTKLNSKILEPETENAKRVIEEYIQLHTESLNVIKFIVEGSKIELTNKEIEMLFNIYVEEYRFTEHGQDILYSFFMKRKVNGSTILNYHNRRYLFENILCSNQKIKHAQVTLKAFH